MIDTVKIFTLVDKDIFEYMTRKMVVRVAFDRSQDDFILYEYSSGSVPSYSTSISVSFAEPTKFYLKPQYLEKMILCLECSWHKVSKMQNAYDGYYNFYNVISEIIEKTENYFSIALPDVKEWFCLKVDIAICKDLSDNINVIKYINSLSRCSYPRRKVRFFTDECLYVSGTTTTLKIYNKLLEFKKNDMKKLSGADFNIFEHCEKIKGFIRFECSIKKKKINNLYKTNADFNYVSCADVMYDDLYSVWSDEFMKLLKLVDSSFEKVWKREDVKERLFNAYGSKKGMMLYTFYTSLLIDGYNNIKNITSKSRFYAKISDLKKCGVDFSRGISNAEINYDVSEESSELSFDTDYGFDIFKLAEVV